MGAEQSTESRQQPSEGPRLAANPPEAWGSPRQSNGASLRPTLPEWDAEHASDSDSEVEYDKQSSAAATDVERAASGGESREPAAAFEAVSQQLVQPLVESSEPVWAEELSSSQPCSSRLELEFVYGYRGADCRRNLCFLPSGEAAYPVANLVVLYEAQAHQQRFYTAHDAAVKCMALHPRGVLIASGQAGDGGSVENAGGVGAPHICVWRPDGLETVAALSCVHHRGVCELAFSPDGERLASIGADAEHTLGLWDWGRGTLLASSQVAHVPIFGLAFSPVGGGDLIATCGAQHLTLWHHDAYGGGLSAQRAQLPPAIEASHGHTAREATVCCMAYLPDGLLLGGTSRGEIWRWAGTRLTARFRAHTGPIYCLELQCTWGGAGTGPTPSDSPSHSWIISAGRDAKLRLWPCAVFAPPTRGLPPPSAVPVRIVNLRDLAAHLTDAAGRPRLACAPSVRALHWSISGKHHQILMGTRSGELSSTELD